MLKPVLYSLRPSGNSIPAAAIMSAVKETWKRGADNGRLSLQPLVDFLGTKNILFLTSGRAALWLTLKALSRLAPDRREVIIPAYTCPAVASAVLKAGLKPVLCDNNLSDFGFSVEDLTPKINKNTLAVVLVHLFGYPANIAEVKDCCRQHGVFLVEDAAQAFGNTLPDAPGNRLGMQGDAGFYSFGRGKPINIMHGGVFVTQSEEIFREAGKVYEHLDHSVWPQTVKYEALLASYYAFSNPFLYWIPQRVPFLHLGEMLFEPEFKVSPGIALAGALISKMIDSTAAEKETRAKNAKWYSTNLQDLPLLKAAPMASFPYLRYPITVNNRETRDRMLSLLMANGTGTARSYRCPLNELPGLREVLGDNNIYPNARKLAQGLITLPVHGGVRETHQRKILEIVRSESRPLPPARGYLEG